MELMLFLCLMMVVGALILCLLLETTVLLQMHRTLTQPIDTNRYHIRRYSVTKRLPEYINSPLLICKFVRNAYKMTDARTHTGKTNVKH